MAYLNEQERDDLLDELVKMNFRQAQRKIMNTDPHARLRFYRNVQRVGEWTTSYVLPSRGAIVTLVENQESFEEDPDIRVRVVYDMARVEIAPTPDNRT